ncbi:Pentatricopeptide repeat-containing protein [Ananas comosus]|uniref:Pentatricopeptide repeat-containing protein n=1 Tax=Ananas comosus TaxID=4615 RepID=A0A199W0Y9_ANACO|nr:Pentatricopeptide repeat-containing protein [Ananas comosus]
MLPEFRGLQSPSPSKFPRHSFSSSSPNRVGKSLTKKVCIELLRWCNNTNQLKQIHAQTLVASLHRSREVFDKLIGSCAHPEHGDVNYADVLFHSEEDPSLFVYNVMIKAFAKNGIFKRTVDLYSRMREKGLFPDNFTYPFVLKSMGILRMGLEGRKTHSLVVKTGFEFDPFTRNALLDMYAEMGRIEIARYLFDETPQRDVVLWNAMIASYVKCERFEEAIRVYRSMEQEGLTADEATLVSTLSACAQMGNLDLGKSIHRCMNTGIHFSLPLGNALLDMYVKCGCLVNARKLFNEMPIRNVASWTTMVTGYANSGQLDEARWLFDRSPAKDVILWTVMINGYVRCCRFEDAMALFRDMQLNQIKPDKFTVVALLTCCASLGALEQGKRIHGHIEDTKMKIDAILGTALIEMYAKCGCIEKSLKIFRRIEGKDATAWTSIICGLATNGQTYEALALFAEMEKVKAKPDDITLIGVLSACNHGGLVDEGCKYFHAMKEVYQIEPKVEHYSCLVDLLGRAGLLDKAEKLLDEMPKGMNSKDAVPLWGALLGACRLHGDVQMGARLAKRAIEVENENVGMHTLLANIYAVANRWEDAMKVRKQMKDLGAKKTPGCTLIGVQFDQIEQPERR